LTRPETVVEWEVAPVVVKELGIEEKATPAIVE
jgi:hypothetical protein